MKSNQFIINHVQYWDIHCFCFGMQPFILKHCHEGDNILIVNVKKILHTDPSFSLAGFGVLPNYIFSLQPALNAQLIYQVLQICTPI